LNDDWDRPRWIGQPLPGCPANPADGAITVGAGGRYNLLDTARWQASLEYDLYQTLHFREDIAKDFNLRSNRVTGSAGYAVTPELWTGVQAGYEHYALGGEGYSGAPFVTPFVSLIESGWGLTQLVYEHADVTYLSSPFENVRDGPTDTASLSQTLYWGPGYFTVGYEFGSERPRAQTPAADDYRERYHQGSVGVGFSPGWRTTVDVTYLFRYENYPEPNTAALLPPTPSCQRLASCPSRQDTVSQFSVSVRRPLTSYLSVGLAYYGTVDNSNIAIYQYRRNIVAAELRVAY
jgi:hypothetical protein